MSNNFINQIILKYVLQKNNKINNKKLNNIIQNYKNIKNYLENLLKHFDTYNEIIYRILYNEEIQHYCPVCNKPLKYYGKHNWANHCSTKCSSLDPKVQQKNINTNQQKYGVDYPAHLLTNNFKTNNPSKNEKIKEKVKKTCLEKYGVKYGWNNETQKKTLINKYGVDNIRKSKYCKKKIKKTLFDKYGNEKYNNREKYKKTCLEKYGVDNPIKSENIKNKLIKKLSLPEIKLKSYLTKKKNNSFNKSTLEDLAYELLKEKYTNVIRQYRSELYPFNCDFYIPSIDLYIECNYSQFHNKHFFNENNKDDIKSLEELKEKANQSKRHKEGKKSQYDMMIYVWTDLDIRKRDIAIKNNLNYKVFWDIEELKEWINNKGEY